MLSIVFTGGGTGGHIFPGLAVAEVLKASTDYEIVWIGSKNGIDKSIVESENLKFIGIPAGKLRRYFSILNFIDVFKIFGGFIKSLCILLKLKPVFVFSKGGFVSVPPVIAARILKIPVITHECDFSPGLATKINAQFAKNVLVSYPETIPFFKHMIQKKTICTGNPVRLKFYNADSEKGKEFIHYQSDKPILLILGGSLGSKQINGLVENSIEFLTEHFFVVHQTGEKNLEQIEAITLKLSQSSKGNRENYKAYPFITGEMPDILAAATLVISRAGANTVWEAAAAGKPMILIPLEKGSSRGDQVENAAFFKKAGAAEVLCGNNINTEQFENIIKKMLFNKELLNRTATASLNLANKKPAIVISDFFKKEFNLICR